jgi:hypothetical protein
VQEPNRARKREDMTSKRDKDKPNKTKTKNKPDKNKNELPIKTGFRHDKAAQKFCAMMVLSAIDEARCAKGQDITRPTEVQLNARHFLIAKDNRAMIRAMLEALAIDPEWFFARVLYRLIKQKWPAVRRDKKSSGVHGKGDYQLFDELYEQYRSKINERESV